MKKLIVLLLLIFVTTQFSSGQVIYSNKIDSILSLVSLQNICKTNRELSGDTLVTIGGVSQLLFSRYWSSQGNIKAAQYIFEKFQSYGLSPKYMANSSTNINVYAVKTGTKFPNRKFIIGAHYDNVLTPVYPGPLDTVHGADDNASGVCGMLEAARLLANIPLDYTVIFVAFDEEEAPVIISGSKGFADSCYARGDTLLGVLNLDMLGYDSNNDGKANVLYDTNSMRLYQSLYSVNYTYNLGLYLVLHATTADHTSFLNRGYRAITLIEQITADFNPYYHTIYETFDKFNVQYYLKMVKTSVATLLTWSLNLNALIIHTPLTSRADTAGRIASAEIIFPSKIAGGTNTPRLYYKVNNGSYNFVNASSINGNFYNFVIPGKPHGSIISYYLSAQDSAGTHCTTLPIGGSGLNPPGTTPPTTVFSYEIYSNNNQCSNTLPKPVNDFQYTYDTICVSQTGKLIHNIKINLTIYHPDDGDLIIQLKGPNGTINLSQGNGSGGSNYINTTFDDSASTSITQGTPPFTGSYKPQNPLSFFKNQSATAPWILRVFDLKAGNSGTLISWCILLELKNSVSAKEQNIPVKYELSQNYPNPFNPTTNIKFQIPKNEFVILKVYDVLGKEVATLVNENLKAGEYQAVFNGSGLASGMYFYKLETGNFTEIKRMVLVK